MSLFAKMFGKKAVVAVITIFAMGCLWAVPAPAPAFEMTVDMNSLIYETQKASRAMNDVLLAWWVPQELWLMFLNRASGVDEAKRHEYLDIMDPYMVFMVVDGVIQKDGVPMFASREAVLKNLSLEDSDGNMYSVLDESQISQDAKDFLSRVFPSFARNLGPLGNNLYYAVFSSRNKKGEPIANAFLDGTFVLHMKRRSFRWRTPLGALVPPKHCPITGEELNGGWKYNPWNGAKLD